MEKKYQILTDPQHTITYKNRTLHRIQALKDFGNVEKGDIGGFIEKESNLSQEELCWIYNDAKVYGNAKVRGHATIADNAVIKEKAFITGHSMIYRDATICGYAITQDNAIVGGTTTVNEYAIICGNAELFGDAKVTCDRDYYVGKNIWSSGRYFTYTRSNRMWRVGCFHGTGKQLIAKAYKDSTISGREYERIVNYVEAMYADLEKDANT